TPVRCVKSFAAKCMLASALPRAGNFPEPPMRKAISTPTSPSPAIIPEAASTPGSLSAVFPLRFASTMRRTMPPTNTGARVPGGKLGGSEGECAAEQEHRSGDGPAGAGGAEKLAELLFGGRGADEESSLQVLRNVARLRCGDADHGADGEDGRARRRIGPAA